MTMDDEKAAYTAQLARDLPAHLVKQARDYLRREKPEWDRERVEAEAIASVRAWQTEQNQVIHERVPPFSPPAPPAPQRLQRLLRRGGGDVTPWLVFAAKRNGVMQ